MNVGFNDGAVYVGPVLEKDIKPLVNRYGVRTALEIVYRAGAAHLKAADLGSDELSRLYDTKKI
jgi:hypothetical protein